MKKINFLSNFIEKSKIIHNNKYNYSLVVYKNAKTKVKIICPEHGVFEQTPDNHSRVNGSGCQICNGGVKSSKKDFITKSKIVHDNKYDYSFVNYIDNKTKVKIICPEHEIFEQTPNSHLHGYECYKCGIKKRVDSKTKKTDVFIYESKIIHNDLYDYSLVEYKNTKTKVKIICNKHGIFEQSPRSHLNGTGCPNCKLSKGENKIKEILNKKNIYYIQQYRFPNCKFIRTLPFDFYLPQYNICIEYDGEQHFNNKFYNHDNIVKNDNIKTTYCENIGIKLIRIPFHQFKSIEDILFFLDK